MGLHRDHPCLRLNAGPMMTFDTLARGLEPAMGRHRVPGGEAPPPPGTRRAPKIQASSGAASASTEGSTGFASTGNFNPRDA